MFDKSSQFQEQTQSSVKFHCKKFIMRKILHHLHGGKLEVSDCTCVQIVEMLDMLRFLLLKDTFDALEDHLKMQLCTMRPIEECLSCGKMKRKFLHNQSLNHHGRGGEGKVARPRRSHKKWEIVHFASGI